MKSVSTHTASHHRSAQTHLLPPNLAIAPRPALLLQRLYAALEHVAEGARVGDEVLELLHDPLRRRVVRVVQRASMQV